MAIKQISDLVRDEAPTLALYAAASVSAYVFGIIVYRLYFHPLARFPGPKLAALTSLYEDYFQWSHEGTFPDVLERLHAKYGDFIRIRPDEIHIADPDCYDAIYNFSNEIDRRSALGGKKPIGGGLFGQSTVDDSKLHRRPYNPPFSRPAVIKKEELIRTKIKTIVDALDEACGTDKVVDISSYYRALTTDIIASFAFGKDMDLLNNIDRGERLYAVWRAQWRRVARFEMHGFRHKILPWMEWIVAKLPWRGSSAQDPASIAAYLEYHKEMQSYIADTLVAIKELPKGSEDSEATGQLPAFQEALRSRHAGPIHSMNDALFANGNTVFIAGSETTASSMGTGAYHLLANPSILQRLQTELDKAWTDGSPTWIDLEQIPLLKGVVMEALRLDNGVSRRFPRINWQSDTRLNDAIVIPRGYTMSMSHRFMFYNPRIFPDPKKFDPNRWTQSDEETQRLSKHMHPFSKGTRACLAYSVAQAELYLAFAEVHRRFDLELYNTTREDVECVVDRIVSFPKAGKMTVKVKVKAKRV